MGARRILTAVARAHRMTLDQLLEKTRRKDVTKPRQMAMLILRETTTCSLPRIGEVMNRDGVSFDHTTVMYGLKRARHWIETDPVFKATYLELRRSLGVSELRAARDLERAEQAQAAA